MPVDEAGEADASVPDGARTGRLQVCLPQVWGGCGSAPRHPLEAYAMKSMDGLNGGGPIIQLSGEQQSAVDADSRGL